MSSAPPKLLSYYSNKVNIYNSDCYIKLPDWNSCPPPPQIYIIPEYVHPPAGPYAPPIIVPLPLPTYYAGEFCGGAAPRASCGPCGR